MIKSSINLKASVARIDNGFAEASALGGGTLPCNSRQKSLKQFQLVRRRIGTRLKVATMTVGDRALMCWPA